MDKYSNVSYVHYCAEHSLILIIIFIHSFNNYLLSLLFTDGDFPETLTTKMSTEAHSDGALIPNTRLT